MNNFGAQDMVAPLSRVMMMRPGAAMADADPTDWHYAGPLSLNNLCANHDALVHLIEATGTEVLLLDDDHNKLADAVFTHDPSLVTSEGAVLLRMGKPLRRGEEDVHRGFYQRQGIPILGTIQEPGTVEAGDCVWLDSSTLLVGMGFRTNEQGIKQLSEILTPLAVSVMAYDLPVVGGPDSCLHLMSMISLLDYDLALVYQPLLPVRLQQFLEQRNVQCLPAPEDEYRTSGSVSVNALTLAPRHCAMVEGFPKTVDLVHSAGCQVSTFPGAELCLKAEGGPTCLTRPILRG